ncbi:hypothetical protein [Mucilaginibacter agri]|uniref:hypothetical protein n=1 Tax=Mucilaginibacter agri TaxID=2695265 RepID=UPI001FB7674F|nr:hypothetical protein [Mucilaginibacter agri]
MYKKTAMETMNKAIMTLYFFEPINRFKNQPAAKQYGQKQENGVHIFFNFLHLAKPCTKPSAISHYLLTISTLNEKYLKMGWYKTKRPYQNGRVFLSIQQAINYS